MSFIYFLKTWIRCVRIAGSSFIRVKWMFRHIFTVKRLMQQGIDEISRLQTIKGELFVLCPITRFVSQRSFWNTLVLHIIKQAHNLINCISRQPCEDNSSSKQH